MCMLELTRERYTKYIAHVWDLISLHAQRVQCIIKFDILDM